jgi:hypothetical protein
MSPSFTSKSVYPSKKKRAREGEQDLPGILACCWSCIDLYPRYTPARLPRHIFYVLLVEWMMLGTVAGHCRQDRAEAPFPACQMVKVRQCLVDSEVVVLTTPCSCISAIFFWCKGRFVNGRRRRLRLRQSVERLGSSMLEISHTQSDSQMSSIATI